MVSIPSSSPSPATSTIPVRVRRNATADPGLIGLLGFVLATATAQLAHLGVQEESPVFWVGAVFGGIVQVTAGMLSYFDRDDFHFVVYNAFGWYWIVVPGFLLSEQLGVDVSDVATGFFVAAFAVVALMFVPAAAVHNSVLPVTLISVSAGLGLQSISYLAVIPVLETVGAVVLLLAASLAAYMLIEKFYWRTMGRHFLPLGPPWIPMGADPES